MAVHRVDRGGRNTGSDARAGESTSNSVSDSRPDSYSVLDSNSDSDSSGLEVGVKYYAISTASSASGVKKAAEPSSPLAWSGRSHLTGASGAGTQSGRVGG